MKKSEIKKRIKKIINEELIPLLEKDGQILVIIYNDKEYMTSGYGCRGCSVKTALEFALTNINEVHDEDNRTIISNPSESIN